MKILMILQYLHWASKVNLESHWNTKLVHLSFVLAHLTLNLAHFSLESVSLGLKLWVCLKLARFEHQVSSSNPQVT